MRNPSDSAQLFNGREKINQAPPSAEPIPVLMVYEADHPESQLRPGSR